MMSLVILLEGTLLWFRVFPRLFTAPVLASAKEKRLRLGHRAQIDRFPTQHKQLPRHVATQSKLLQ